MHTLIIFDLDDTLAESKAPISPLMADSIARLLMRRQVAIITGGKYEQILKQVVTHLPVHADFSRLHLFPTCGAAYFRFLSGKWENVYFERLTEENIKKISKALLTAQEQA